MVKQQMSTWRVQRTGDMPVDRGNAASSNVYGARVLLAVSAKPLISATEIAVLDADAAASVKDAVVRGAFAPFGGGNGRNLIVLSEPIARRFSAYCAWGLPLAKTKDPGRAALPLDRFKAYANARATVLHELLHAMDADSHASHATISAVAMAISLAEGAGTHPSDLEHPLNSVRHLVNHAFWRMAFEAKWATDPREGSLLCQAFAEALPSPDLPHGH